MIEFTKFHGLGNDFIVVEAPEFDREVAKALCDRHRGIGADGVLLTGVTDGRAFMRVINADGSTAEMCGNGIRCIAKHLRQRGLVTQDEFVVDTDGGEHRIRMLGDLVEVSMAVPRLDPDMIPVRATERWRDAAVSFAVGGEDREVHLTAVSMGNPHVVTFDALSHPERAVLGPIIETDARFPMRTNVGFASIEGKTLELAVWERGVGFTNACGTGACAAGVAAVITGRAAFGDSLTVTLPGGPLTIVVPSLDAPVLMTGPAVEVFRGMV